MVDADEGSCIQKEVFQNSETAGGQLWKNGHFKKAYDELGHCLGSGGMGTVWAAHVSNAASSSRYRGRWVAVKAIPILLPESRAGSALHQGLRECLSTFQDLSSAHVVRYETYWLEEPEHLPEAMQQLHRPRAAQLKKEVQEDSPWVSSLRFRARAGSGNALRRTRSSEVYPTFSGLSESCGFIWDVDSAHGEVSAPSTPPARVVWQDVKATKAKAKQVVLLIEMELMGPAPDGSISDERRTLTLRSWLQSEQRTLSDAADVFGSLMLSVRHIHRKRIVHSDLKPDNIFCVAERSKVKVVRIGDFGLAGENQLFRQFDQFSLKMLTTKNGMGGTPGYTAPEILLHARNGHGTACSDKVDIYSCAVILLELLLQPFRTHMERIITLDKFSQNKMVPGYVAMRLPKTRGLLQEMAESDPAARLSAEEICKRFEKEVRKELCRSASQLCCNSSPAFEKCPDSARSASKQDDSGKRRKGKRRS